MIKKSRVVTGKVPQGHVDILLEFERIKRRGDVQKIASELGLTLTYVSMCINGHYPNEDVLEKAAVITEERKSKWAQALKRIRQY